MFAPSGVPAAHCPSLFNGGRSAKRRAARQRAAVRREEQEGEDKNSIEAIAAAIQAAEPGEL
jgi:hypothetical protein